MGKELEVRTIGPGEIAEFMRELDQMVEAMVNPETKYNFRVGIKDVEFAVDEEEAGVLGITLPGGNIEQAERLLQEGVITPTKFIEEDDTSHQVLKFDPTPVGCSGFDNCVIHSLAQTDLGLFEVGRYPAADLESQTRAWQWFIHCKMKQPND